MEILYYTITGSFVTGLAILLAWRFLNWVWLRPKEMEKCLKEQGFNGNSYRLFFGDLKDMGMMIMEALSKPINVSDDIVPRVIPLFHNTIQKYGKNCFAWFGPQPTLLIMDPELVKEVLTRNQEFYKLEGNPLSKLLVASFNNDVWTKHKRIINPAFHLDKLKHMIPAFYTCCNEMLSKWEEMGSSSCELDVWSHLQTLSGDVISRSAFGSNYEEGRKIFELQREQTQHLINASRSLYIPGWRFVPTKRNRRMKEIAKEVVDSIRDIIDKRIIEMKTGEGKNDDLLGMLLESNFKEMKEHKSKTFGLSIEEVIEDCKLFYFAGQETTSVLLSWTMVLLSKHQDWQQRARQEVLQVFGNEKPSFEELNRLKVVNMILHEVLRLYPPVAMLHRRTPQKTHLGPLTLPAEVHLQLPTILLHHDHELWGPDAKEFKPERFSEGVSKATKGKFIFFPFGWGNRICIGQNFVMLEAKLALTMILQHFSFELSPSYTHAPHSMITLQPEYGALLILHKL